MCRWRESMVYNKMCWRQLATALLLALAAGAAAEMASAPAPAMAANLRPGAPALAGAPRAVFACCAAARVALAT